MSNEEKHEWFYEPNEKHPEIPDMSIPKDLYSVGMNNLRTFLAYDGHEMDFKDRYNEGRLVKFICPLRKILVCGSKNNVDLTVFNLILLLIKLPVYKTKHLGFRCLRITNKEFSYDENYPQNCYLTNIRSLFFHRCRIESSFLEFILKNDKDNTDYELTLLYFSDCVITLSNLKIMAKSLKTNYVLLSIKWGNKDKTSIETFSEEAMTLKPSVRLEMDQLRIEIKDYLKRNQRGYGKCRWAIYLMLLANRYERGNVFNTLPLDIIKLIAKTVWKSVGTQIWCYSISLDFLEDDLAEFL